MEGPMTVQEKNTLNQPVLRTEHLSRKVEDKVLVDDVSLEVFSGDVIAIVGPSGAGKSSFLRLLNRLDEPTAGTVYLHGQDYRTIPPRELCRRMGMVLQAPYLFPGTVRENLCFGPLQWGEEIPEDRVEMLLSRVGLSGYGPREVRNLSGGEAQRVSLARTLANSPEVLLLDEPTSSLDPAAERGVEELLVQIIREEHLTCLMVTHDMEQAARLAERALLMMSGRLVKSGTVTEVIHA